MPWEQQTSGEGAEAAVGTDGLVCRPSMIPCEIACMHDFLANRGIRLLNFPGTGGLLVCERRRA